MVNASAIKNAIFDISTYSLFRGGNHTRIVIGPPHRYSKVFQNIVMCQLVILVTMNADRLRLFLVAIRFGWLRVIAQIGARVIVRSMDKFVA
jgi:hypothetical protein